MRFAGCRLDLLVVCCGSEDPSFSFHLFAKTQALTGTGTALWPVDRYRMHESSGTRGGDGTGRDEGEVLCDCPLLDSELRSALEISLHLKCVVPSFLSGHTYTGSSARCLLEESSARSVTVSCISGNK